MKVLIACEESQTVCKAFRTFGHEAFSCDIQECSGGHPDWHLHGDVLEYLNYKKWDLMVAHPPCTYLSNAGVMHLFPKGILNQHRFKKGMEGRDFFMKLLEAPIPKICVENPRPTNIFELPRHTQEIHPYHFGDPFKKATRLWLRGLKPLMPTNIVWKRAKYISARKGDTIANGSVTNQKERSKTFPGIATAMAEQWGKTIKN